MRTPEPTPRPRLGPARVAALLVALAIPGIPSAIAGWQLAMRGEPVEPERLLMHTVSVSVEAGAADVDVSREGSASLRSTGGIFVPPPGDRGWADDPAGAQPGYAVLLTDKIATPELLGAMDATGIDRLQYFPDNGWLVEVGDGTAAEDVAGLGFVRWFGAFPSELKLHFEVREALELMREPLGEGQPFVQLDVAPFGPRDIDLARLRETLDRLQLAVVWESPSAIRVLAEVDQIRALVQEPTVLHVSPAWDEPEPMHAQSMPTIYADRARSAVGFALSQDVAVGVVDSGYQRDHEALPDVTEARSWATEPTGCGGTRIVDPFDDRGGHGTHVAGTILGRGAGLSSPHRGVAPSAEDIYIARIFDQNGKVTGDYAAALQWQAEVVDVSNNSWGCCRAKPCRNIAWRGTGTDSREMDRLAAEHGVIWVVAAGNDGARVCPAASVPNDPCGALDQQTRLGSPGDAKNVITVGASLDGSPNLGDCDVPGQGDVNPASIDDVAAFSGRGPTADSRMKPDLVAPGSGICSADSDDLDGYIGKQGTSMAAPHVTGAVALLLDAVRLDGDGDTPSSLAGRPDAVKALLRASAAQVAANLPDRNYGAGRLDAMRLITDRDQGDGWGRGVALGPAVVTGDRATVEIWVPADATALTAVLAWTEPAAAAGACVAAVHDIDLLLRDPTGVVQDRSRSRRDTVESVGLRWDPATQAAPAVGIWRLEVDARMVNGAQDFAVAWVVDRATVPGIPEVDLTCASGSANVGDTVSCTLTVSGDEGLTRAITARPRPSFTGYRATSYRWELSDGPAMIRTLAGPFPPVVGLGEVEPTDERVLEFDLQMIRRGVINVGVELRWDGWTWAEHGWDPSLNPTFAITVN